MAATGRGYGASAGEKPMIQIGVEVVEVDDQKSRTLGLEWLSMVDILETNVPALFSVGTLTRTSILGEMQVLMDRGAADLLANPKLVTRDGTTATFHAGGELPYAVAGTLGTVTIEFKPYGVNMKITPHVDERGKIAMSLDAEVSSPDTQNSVTLAGNIVPGIRSRMVSSQLTMDAGSTLTLAGLIQNEKEVKHRGVPVLMDIPLLGYLFSRKIETSRKTSIVVFVTPTIINTLESGAQTTFLKAPPSFSKDYPTDSDILPEVPPTSGRGLGHHGEIHG